MWQGSILCKLVSAQHCDWLNINPVKKLVWKRYSSLINLFDPNIWRFIWLVVSHPLPSARLSELFHHYFLFHIIFSDQMPVAILVSYPYVNFPNFKTFSQHNMVSKFVPLNSCSCVGIMEICICWNFMQKQHTIGGHYCAYLQKKLKIDNLNG